MSGFNGHASMNFVEWSGSRAPASGLQQRSLLPWLILLIGVPVSILLFAVLRDDVDNVARLRFERQAAEAKATIDRRIHSYAEILYGLRALFASQESVSRGQFRDFVASMDLETRYPGFDSVNFARYVPRSELESFLDDVRHDTSVQARGYPEFRINPPGDRPEYFVLVYLEPLEGYEFAFGRDLAASTGVSDPTAVAAALRNSRDTGKLAASGMPIRIKAANSEYTGLAMRLAVYRPGRPLETVADRRAAYIGSVGAGFNVERLMTGALDEDTSRYIRFALYDAGPAPTGDKTRRFLFDSGHAGHARVMKGASAQAEFSRVLPLEVGGRVWEIHFKAWKDDVVDLMDELLPWVVLLGGILSSALLSSLFYSLASSRSRAETIAVEMTANLRQNEASLAEAERMAHLGNWSLDPASHAMTWSSETFRILGLVPDSRPRTLTDFLAHTHADDREYTERALVRAMERRQHREFEYRIVRLDGGTRWVHTIVQGNAPPPVAGTMMDITDRKLAEQELLESKALLSDAQKLAGVGCWQYNPADGRHIWSEELYRMYGLDSRSFTPTCESLVKFVHPADRAAWRQSIAEALRRGGDFSTEFRIVRPDGGVRHLRGLGEVIADSAGRPARVLLATLDVTEQKEVERTLRASTEQLTALSRGLVQVQEAERRQLSRELHDRVGQNLTALSINLDILRATLTGDHWAEQRARIDDSSRLLESTVGSIEDVMSELRPPMLDDYGLLPALQWYTKDFASRTGIEVAVLGADDAERLAPDIEITLFRVAQEALTNVAKHAHASHVEIALEHDANRCTMTVSDDGIGIGSNAERRAQHRPRLGIVTMRERVQAIGGRFHVLSVATGGTQIAIEIP